MTARQQLLALLTLGWDVAEPLTASKRAQRSRPAWLQMPKASASLAEGCLLLRAELAVRDQVRCCCSLAATLTRPTAAAV